MGLCCVTDEKAKTKRSFYSHYFQQFIPLTGPLSTIRFNDGRECKFFAGSMIDWIIYVTSYVARESPIHGDKWVNDAFDNIWYNGEMIRVPLHTINW